MWSPASLGDFCLTNTCDGRLPCDNHAGSQRYIVNPLKDHTFIQLLCHTHRVILGNSWLPILVANHCLPHRYSTFTAQEPEKNCSIHLLFQKKGLTLLISRAQSRQNFVHRQFVQLPRISESVRITYNEDSNVIITVTGSASQLRGSEIYPHRQLFLGYRPVGLSKNSAC